MHLLDPNLDPGQTQVELPETPKHLHLPRNLADLPTLFQ